MILSLSIFGTFSLKFFFTFDYLAASVFQILNFFAISLMLVFLSYTTSKIMIFSSNVRHLLLSFPGDFASQQLTPLLLIATKHVFFPVFLYAAHTECLGMFDCITFQDVESRRRNGKRPENNDVKFDRPGNGSNHRQLFQRIFI